MGALRGWHIVVLVIVLVLLFGAPRLPELARSIGKSMRILKEETRSLSDPQPEETAPAAEKPAAKTSPPKKPAAKKSSDS